MGAEFEDLISRHRTYTKYPAEAGRKSYIILSRLSFYLDYH